MKRPGLSLTLPLAMLFVLTGLCAAEPASTTPGAAAPAATAAPVSTSVVKVERAPETPRPFGKMTSAELLKRFDRNGDGKLDEDEREEAHEAMLQDQMARQEAGATSGQAEQFRKRMLELFDKNHDGRLDEQERAEARKYFQEHGATGDGAVQAEILKLFDRNGDGRLDEEERAEMRRALQGRQGGRAPLIAMRQEILRRYDKNGDGKIDDTEWAELSPALRERIQNAPMQLRRYDKNGDGIVDDAEWAAAKAQIRAWLNDAPAGNATAATETPGQPAAVPAHAGAAAGGK